MRVVALSAVLLLAACGESAFEAAQRQYEFQKKNGASETDLCAAAKRVAEAATDEGNSGDYKLWSATSDVHCLAGAASNLDAAVEADRLERMADGNSE